MVIPGGDILPEPIRNQTDGHDAERVADYRDGDGAKENHPFAEQGFLGAVGFIENICAKKVSFVGEKEESSP